MQNLNTNSFFEIGFGSTLCGIIKRIERNLKQKVFVISEEIEV